MMEKLKGRKGHYRSRKNVSIPDLATVVVVVDVALMVALLDIVVSPADIEKAEAVSNLRDTASINKIRINHKAHIEGVFSRIEVEVINNTTEIRSDLMEI